MKCRAKVALFWGSCVPVVKCTIFLWVESRLESWSIRSPFDELEALTHQSDSLWELDATSCYGRRQPSGSGAEVCTHRHLVIPLHLTDHSSELEVS